MTEEKLLEKGILENRLLEMELRIKNIEIFLEVYNFSKFDPENYKNLKLRAK